jgi:DNA-binding transcriptional ArsR family regulator
MKPRDKARFEAWAAIAKALAHPARLAMLDELARHERCVCELAALTALDLSTVSRHVAALRHAGIVECTKTGTRITCRVRCKCVLNFFACVDGVLRANAKAQQALVGRRP